MRLNVLVEITGYLDHELLCVCVFFFGFSNWWFSLYVDSEGEDNHED